MTRDWRSTTPIVAGKARVETPTRARPLAATCARCHHPLQLQAVAGYGDGRAFCQRCADLLDAARGPGSAPQSGKGRA